MMRSPAVLEATAGSATPSGGTAGDEHEAVAGAEPVRRPRQRVAQLHGVGDESHGPAPQDVVPEQRVEDASEDPEVERVVPRGHDLESGGAQGVRARADVEVLQVA